MKNIAIVPVREGSSRVKNKNFRKFHNNQSLLERKINQLKNVDVIDDIYVASNSNIAFSISKKMGVKYIKRSNYMCTDAKLHEYTVDMIKEFNPNDIVLWAMVTNPFFKNYDNVFKEYYENILKGYDSVVTTVDFRDFLIDTTGRCINFNPGSWHTFTQNLPDWKQITGAAYIASVELQRNLKYWMGLNPYFFNVSKLEAIEIDYKEDYDLAVTIAKGLTS